MVTAPKMWANLTFGTTTRLLTGVLENAPSPSTRLEVDATSTDTSNSIGMNKSIVTYRVLHIFGANPIKEI